MSPDAPTLWCSWHVNHCVIAKCKNIVVLNDRLSFEAEWCAFFRSSTKEQYETLWKGFETKYLNAKTKKDVEYLRNEWLKEG